MLPTVPRPVHWTLLETTGMQEPGCLTGPAVFLRPGDWLFGRGDHRVTTVLGSCVSMVMWSPRLRWGGMTHCLLPTRHTSLPTPGHSAGHYVEESFSWLIQRLSEHGCSIDELNVCLAGGACVNDSAIGISNVKQAQQCIQDWGMRLVQQDTGGRVVRRLTFNLIDGNLTISHGGRLGNSEV